MSKTDILELIKQNKVKTPSYIQDIDVLDEHMREVCSIADSVGGDKVELCYAMKANPIIAKHLSDKVRHVEVCSPGEFEICKKEGIAGGSIILSGVNKDVKMISDAISYGVDIITVESVRQYGMVKECIDRGEGSSVRILLRLSCGAQFGMSEDEIEYVLLDGKELPGIDVIGIHFFSGTQKKSVDKDIEEIDRVVSFIERLRKEYAFEPKLFEYGAGLKVPYFIGDDFDNVFRDYIALVEHIAGLDPDYTVGIELGRFMAFNSMYYCTTVDDVKKVDDSYICIVDGGIHHINYYGQNMAMRTPVIEHIKMDAFDKYAIHDGALEVDSESDWKICGSLCTFADILVRKIAFSGLRVGDVLLFHNVGAYSMTESPALFLSRQLPRIYSYSDTAGLNLLRDVREAYEINI